MKKRTCIFLLLLLGGFANADSSKKTKAKSKLSNGEEFQHPRTSRRCLTKKDCIAVSAKYCQSRYSRPTDCFEQYSGVWITRCRCEKKDKS